jgi:hypothetical protein
MTGSPPAARRWIGVLVAVASIVLAAFGCGAPGDAEPMESKGGSGGSMLDGVERSFVIVGDSTSYAWPRMLQEMLDEHSGQGRLYHVLNAVVGGSPVSRWIADPASEDYDETFGAMLRDFFGPDARLRGDAPEPDVALCQPSVPITGADALENLALRLHERGIERVYIATPTYEEPSEPDFGDGRGARSTLLDRGHDFVYEGPDVWTPTRDARPEAFEEDGLYPSQLGMKIIAERWYRVLAGDGARREVVDRLYATDYDIETLMTDYINGRRP